MKQCEIAALRALAAQWRGLRANVGHAQSCADELEALLLPVAQDQDQATAESVLVALTTCYRCECLLLLDGPVQCEDGCDATDEDEDAADERKEAYRAVIEGWGT